MRKAYDIELWLHMWIHIHIEKERVTGKEKEGGEEEREKVGLRENGTSSFQRIVK